MKKHNIVIVGAGMSGLTAALQLEKQGYAPTIIEADVREGGKVQSDTIDGYILDRGFQVLLTAYPLVKKYLNLEKLDVETFKLGSYIFKNKNKQCIGDPLRDRTFLYSTLFSSVGTFLDKLKIFKLKKELEKKSIDIIFKTPEVSTLQYLEDFGFSSKIISEFFKPFFTGIFLETNLKTSSRMFEFIFKMLGEENVVIPKNGMQAIPQQLMLNLKRTKIKFNKKVNAVVGNQITLEDGSKYIFDYCIVATEASGIIPNLSSTKIEWKCSQTLYFEVEKTTVFDKQMIGLLANESNAVINSIYFPFTKNTKHKLLSVTVVKKHKYSEFELIQQVERELNEYFTIKPIRYLKTYEIPKSLPNLEDMRYDVHFSEMQLTGNIFLAGDTMLNGSINAAMLSGELAAKAVHEKITGNFF